MVILSMLQNTPVIEGSRQIGLLQGISLDPTQKRVRALIVSRGFRGKCLIPREDILSVSNGFILAGSLQRFSRKFDRIGCAFVRDTDGRLIGRVTDYAINPISFQLTAIAFSPGSLPPECFVRIWAYAFEHRIGEPHTITVPISFCHEPIVSKEGM